MAVVAFGFYFFLDMSFWILVFMLFSIFLIILILFFIQKNWEKLDSEKIKKIIAGEFILELVGLQIMFCFVIPIINYYIGSGIFLYVFILFFFTMFSIPIFRSKKYNFFFLITASFLIIVTGLVEYFGLSPSSYNFPSFSRQSQIGYLGWSVGIGVSLLFGSILDPDLSRCPVRASASPSGPLSLPQPFSVPP